VMTGFPAENRDSTNPTVSRVLQEIAEEGLRDQVLVLGLVSRMELVRAASHARYRLTPGTGLVHRPGGGWSQSAQDLSAGKKSADSRDGALCQSKAVVRFGPSRTMNAMSIPTVPAKSKSSGQQP
jgi:hypothetical protein